MKTESAILIETTAGLSSAVSGKHDRIYFGHETCERRIPSSAELNEAKKFCNKNGFALSLMTPFCTNSGLKKIRPLLNLLSKQDEVIVNDFGILKTVSEKSKAEPVCGRLLNRQYRDPRIAEFKNAPKPMLEHLSKSHTSTPQFISLLKSFGVKRAELDNLLQGIGTDLAGTGFKASLYFPLVFISATRLCLTANCTSFSKAKNIGIFPCKKECIEFSFRLENPEFKQPLYLIGNALYFKNNSMPKELFKKGIDRIVTSEKLPPSE